MARSQTLENAHKKVMEGNLNEIMEINRQIYGGDFKKVTNKAENELKKTEEAVKAAQAELGIWDNEPELLLEELDAAASQSAASPSNPTTPHTPAIPGPLTPNTQGARYGAKKKTKPGSNQFGFKSTKGGNKNNQQNSNKQSNL